MKAPKLCGGEWITRRCVLMAILLTLLLNYSINYLFIHFGGFNISFAEASGNKLKQYVLLRDEPTGFIMNFRDEYTKYVTRNIAGNTETGIAVDYYNFFDVDGKVVYLSGSTHKKAFQVFPSYLALDRFCENTEEEIRYDKDVSKQINVIKNMSVFGLKTLGMRDYFFRFLYIDSDERISYDDAEDLLIESKINCLKNLKETAANHKEYNEKMKDPQFRAEQKALIDSVLSVALSYVLSNMRH